MAIHSIKEPIDMCILSNTFPWLMYADISKTATAIDPFENWYDEPLIQRFNTRKLNPEEYHISTRDREETFNFVSNLSLCKFGNYVTMHDEKNRNSITVYLADTALIETFEEPKGQNYFTNGPSDAAWIVWEWEYITPKQSRPVSETLEAEKEINTLLNAFKAGKPLMRSSETSDLANEVAKQIGLRDSENIDEWSERLADDVSKAKD